MDGSVKHFGAKEAKIMEEMYWGLFDFMAGMGWLHKSKSKMIGLTLLESSAIQAVQSGRSIEEFVAAARMEYERVNCSHDDHVKGHQPANSNIVSISNYKKGAGK